MAPRLIPHRSWPELVMHVLAHVRETAALPASLYDPIYVARAAARLGPAAERPLAEDAAVIGRTLVSHQALGRVQLLAWLFDEVDEALACADRDLGELGPGEVARPELLAPLVSLGPALEVLRCAALLEAEVLPHWPLAVEAAALSKALGEVMPAAPALEARSLLCLRALRLRGRLFGEEIWVGAPSAELELEPDHAAWQAAHEATVRELSREMDSGEREVEAAAVVLLAARAREEQLAAAHAGWLAHFGAIPSDAQGLDEPARAIVERLLRSGRSPSPR